MFHHPLAGRDKKIIEQHKVPKPDDPSQLDGVTERCKRIRDRGYTVVFNQGFGFGLLHPGTQLLGYEDYFSRLSWNRKSSMR